MLSRAVLRHPTSVEGKINTSLFVVAFKSEAITLRDIFQLTDKYNLNYGYDESSFPVPASFTRNRHCFRMITGKAWRVSLNACLLSLRLTKNCSEEFVSIFCVPHVWQYHILQRHFNSATNYIKIKHNTMCMNECEHFFVLLTHCLKQMKQKYRV